jgi:hypothetical protein
VFLLFTGKHLVDPVNPNPFISFTNSSPKGLPGPLPRCIFDLKSNQKPPWEEELMKNQKRVNSISSGAIKPKTYAQIDHHHYSPDLCRNGSHHFLQFGVSIRK